MASSASARDYEFDGALLVFQPSAAGDFTFAFRASNSLGTASATLTATVSDWEETKYALCVGINEYEDLNSLKIKQEMGASFFITQLFFDNNYYYRLVRVAHNMGITIPIIPGIMPLTSAAQFNKILNMAGASIPFELRVLFDRFRNDKKAMYEIGIAYSVNQILELLANDADGIHIYTMNNANVAGDIYRRIENVIENALR